MIWYLPFYLQCEPRLVSAVDKQMTESTYVCLPHLQSGKLFSDLGSQTLCAQVFGRPGARDEDQVLFSARQHTAVKTTTCPEELCDVICQLRLLFYELPPWSPQRNSGQRDLGMQRWLGRNVRHQRRRLLPVLQEMMELQCPKRRLGKNKSSS